MSLAWRRRGEAFVCESWTPDLLADRDERIGWMAERGIPWSIKDGQLSARESKADVLGLIQEAMQLGRTEWKPRMRVLETAGVPVAGEGTYGTLAAYPLPASETGLTLSATEQGLIPAAHIPVYTPLPINGILAPQAYRVILSGIFTSVATSGNLTLTPRLGNANTSPSLGSSAATAMTHRLGDGRDGGLVRLDDHGCRERRRPLGGCAVLRELPDADAAAGAYDGLELGDDLLRGGPRDLRGSGRKSYGPAPESAGQRLRARPAARRCGGTSR
jgi:hypothetical protein